MGLLIFLQVLVDLAFIAISTLLLIERSKARTAEDPRLSRGLQMLTSKIAILQDLMDRSETTGRQLSQILDNKQSEVQERMEEVEVHLHKIQRATEKSHEVAKIFQDRIPHQEIIERQNSLKYLQAAKMANQGFSIEEIARNFDIPRGELELIVKVNRDRILNTEEPAWLETTRNQESTSHPSEFVIQNLQQGAREMDTGAMKRMLNDVHAAVQPQPTTAATTVATTAAPSTLSAPPAWASAMTSSFVTTAKAPEPVAQRQFGTQNQAMVQTAPAATATPTTAPTGMHFRSGKQPHVIDSEIKPVVFKKISVLDDLG